MAKMNLKLITILSISHVFIDLTGGALPVLLPFLKEELHLNYAQVGTVIMISNLCSSIIQPFFGHLSDKRPIRWLVPVSVAITYLGFSFVGLSPRFFVLLLLVMISGLGVACFHPEGFRVMHSLAGSRMATGMSFFQVGGNVGIAAGPLFAAYAMELAGLRGTLLFGVPGLAVLATLLIFSRQWSSLGEATGPTTQAVEAPAENHRSAWISMGFLVVAVALRAWAHAGILTFLPFYYMNVLHGDAITGGKLVFIFLMGGAAGTLIGGMSSDRIGHKKFFLLSMAFSTPLLFLLLQASGPWLAVLLFITGLVLISSFSVTIVMGQQILSHRLGMASGLMIGFVIGVGGVGAGLLGLIADAWGVLTVLKLIAFMPMAGLIPLLFVRDPMRKAVGAARSSSPS